MKRNNILIFVILFPLCFIPQKSFAQQPQLYIDQVDSFPLLPFDTAFQQQPKNFTIRVRNFTNQPSSPNAYLKIFLRNVDTTLLSQPEQMLDSSILISSLVGLDTIIVPISGYYFTPATYRTGNNIVVVWPRIGNDTSSTYDSLQLDTVYFVPLASVSILSVKEETFSVFPNPAINEINLIFPFEKHIEYVRVLNDIGQEIQFSKSTKKALNVKFLSEGFYFLEIRDRSGTLSRKKFLKL